MKRYIRLKNGKIIDFNNVWIKETFDKNSIHFRPKEVVEKMNANYYESYLKNTKGSDIVAESDNILDLMQVGDLICYEPKHTVLNQDNYDYIHDKDERDDIIEFINNNIRLFKALYTKQGNDFILVARKTENEWEVI